MSEGEEDQAAMDDEEKEILRKEVRNLSERVAELEVALGRASQPFSELVDQFDGMRSIAGNYFRLLELYQRKGAISPEAVLPELKDPIAIEIVRVRFDQGGLNVSEITERLRERRGSASRTIVRKRLKTMVEDGIIGSEKGPGGVSQYTIAEEVTDRWFRLLGLRR
jgi:DNA-binding transcriptional ArsR family regulator